MIELAWLALMLVAAMGLGRAMLGWLRLAPADVPQQWVYGMALGLGVMSYGVLLLAALHLLTWVWAAALLAVAGAVGARALMRLPAEARAAWAWLRAAPRPPLVLVLAGVLGLHVVMNLVSAFNPPVDSGATAYNLAIPDLYIQNNAIITRADIIHTYWPQNGQMLFLLGVLLRGDLLAQLMSFAYSLLALAAIAVGSRGLIAPAAAAVAAYIFYTLPVVGNEASMASADIMVGAYAALACCALAMWRQTGARQWLGLSALMAGLAPAFKLSGAAVPALLVAAVLLQRAPWRVRLGNAAAFGLAAGLLVAPWLLKTALVSGNPVTPYLYSVFGAAGWTAETAQAAAAQYSAVRLDRTVWNFVRLPWLMTMDDLRFAGGAIGPIFLGALPILLLAGKRPPLVRAALWFSLAYLALWFISAQVMRDFIPALPALCVAAAWALVVWAGTGRLPGAATAALLLAVGLLNLGLLASNFTRPPGSTPPAKSLRASLGLEAREAYLARIDSGYAFIDAMNARLPADSLTLLMGMDRTYGLERDFVRGYPVIQPLFYPHTLPNTDAMAAQARRLGVTHVVIDRNRDAATSLARFDSLSAPPGYAVRLEDFAARHLDLIMAQDNYALYAMRAGGAP